MLKISDNDAAIRLLAKESARKKVHAAKSRRMNLQIMIKKSRFLSLFLAITATACGSSMNTADIKQNPHPNQRYELTIIVDGAPGSFESVEADMQFDIANAPSCAPKDSISGATPTPDFRKKIELTRVKDSVYRGTFFLDLLEDEDYYGKGVCHWSFSAAGMTMKSHGVTFFSGLPAHAIAQHEKIMEYMPERVFFGSKVPGLAVPSEPMSDDIKNHREDYFSVTMRAEELPNE